MHESKVYKAVDREQMKSSEWEQQKAIKVNGMKVKKADSAGGQAWACLSAEFRRRCTEGRLKDIEGDREANGWYAILCYMLYHAMIYYGML